MSSDPVDRSDRLVQAAAARSTRRRDVGTVVIGLGVAIFLVPCVIVFVVWRTGLIKSDLTGLVLLPAWAFALGVVTQGRRMRIAGGEDVLAGDERAPIVYLRPFDADDQEIASAWTSRVRTSPWQHYITHEQRLARALRKVGPFVAVGDPTEELPLLGAARMYAADDDWHMTVDELSARAGVVLLQTGDSDGLAWEVDHVIALGTPERVILTLPAPGRRRRRGQDYDAFRRRFGDLFPRRLPASIGDCQFAFFDTDWTPRLVGKRYVPLPAGDAPRDAALRQLAREFRITWGPRWVRYAAYFTAFLVAVTLVQVATG